MPVKILKPLADAALRRLRRGKVSFTSPGKSYYPQTGDPDYELLTDYRGRYIKEKVRDIPPSGISATIKRPHIEKDIVNLGEYEGRGFITARSDRSGVGQIIEINGQPLAFGPINLYGGQDYMYLRHGFNNPSAAWASGSNIVKPLLKRADALRRETGKDPLFIPWRMGPASVDFQTSTGEVMLAYNATNLNSKAKKRLDKALKSIIKDWKGIDDPASIDVWRSTPVKTRNNAMHLMDDQQYREEGGLSRGAARLIVTDPAQYSVARRGGLQNIAELTPDPKAGASFPGGHPSFDTDIGGRPIGQFSSTNQALMTVYDLLDRSQKKWRQATNPISPTHLDIWGVEGPSIPGIITENILKRMSDRGISVNALVGLSPGATAFALTSGSLITPDEVMENGVSEFVNFISEPGNRESADDSGALKYVQDEFPEE